MMNDYFNETIQVKKQTGRDFGGNATYSAPIESPARVKEKFQLVRDKTSKEVTASLEIKVPKETDIDVEYIVKYQGNDYTVITKSNKKDLDGNVSHKKVYC